MKMNRCVGKNVAQDFQPIIMQRQGGPPHIHRNLCRIGALACLFSLFTAFLSEAVTILVTKPGSGSYEKGVFRQICG